MLNNGRIYELWDEARNMPYAPPSMAPTATITTFARAVEREARKQALKEAAKKVERIVVSAYTAKGIANMIRALARKKP